MNSKTLFLTELAALLRKHDVRLCSDDGIEILQGKEMTGTLLNRVYIDADYLGIKSECLEEN